MTPAAHNNRHSELQPSGRDGAAGLSLSYPFDWTDIEDFSEYQFTEDRIPRVYLGKRLGWQFYPITVAQWGLFRLQTFAVSQDAAARRDALNAADWLVEHAKPWGQDGLAWVHEWPLDFYGTPGPWISAMAQGEAISLLLRAHSLTSKPAYLEVARAAFRTFADGSVCARYPDGSLSLEEYPANPPAHVLNGAVFACLGLFDYAIYTGEADARDLRDEAVRGIQNNLHRYDTGFWTRYDLFPVFRLASRAYHEIHIRQMRILNRLTRETDFLEYERRWLRYQKSARSSLLWAVGKALEKIRLRFRGLFATKQGQRP